MFLLITSSMNLLKKSGKKLKDKIIQFKEHTSLKNGLKKKTKDKHTKPRPGRQNEKKKLKENWKKRK